MSAIPTGNRIVKLALAAFRKAAGDSDLAYKQTRNQAIYDATYNVADIPVDPLSMLVTAKAGMIGVDLRFDVNFGAGNYDNGWIVTRNGIPLVDSVDESDNPWSCICGIQTGTVHTSWVPNHNTIKIRDNDPLIGEEVLYELQVRETGAGAAPVYFNYGGTTPQATVESFLSTAIATGVYANA